MSTHQGCEKQVKGYLVLNITHEGQHLPGAERGRALPSADSFPECPQLLGLAARSQELDLSSPCGWQKPKSFSHHLLPARLFGRQPDQKHGVARTWSRHSSMGYRHPKGWLNLLQPSTYPSAVFKLPWFMIFCPNRLPFPTSHPCLRIYLLSQSVPA